MGVPKSTLPIKYLGLPMSYVYPKARHYSPLIDKMSWKIDGWQLHFLSFAGRVELIKEVLHDMLSYLIFSFRMPQSVVTELEMIFSNFICGGKMHIWNWKEICRPKTEGGLGIRRISDINMAYGIRLVWRICSVNSIWPNWMKVNYLKNSHLAQAKASITDSHTWKWICHARSLALQHMPRKLGNGVHTSLLLDRWISSSIGTLIHFITESQISPELL